MKVCVYGLWHLGTVTAAGTASGGHTVIGLDPDASVVEGLRAAQPPVFEPGLADLIRDGVDSGRLRFTSDIAGAVRDVDVVWVTFDTPVDEDDRADVEAVVGRMPQVFPHLRDGSLVLMSSQLPVGTTRRVEEMFVRAVPGRRVGFACIPENLRLGSAIATFTRPDRVVAGVRSDAERQIVAELLAPFTDRIEWMSVESAEMTKHALNAFLATSVAFANEIAAICEQVGADASEVERGLKSDGRIGAKAYLSPGGAFAGGTLARDISLLSDMARQHSVPAHVVPAVKISNDAHRLWAQRRLCDVLGALSGRTVAVWGLTYKPGTDTLRRSSALELCAWLGAQGAEVRAHDPAVQSLPDRFAPSTRLVGDPLAAVEGAAALVVATPWADYRGVDANAVAALMSGNVVLDANRFLSGTLGQHVSLRYISVGRAHA